MRTPTVALRAAAGLVSVGLVGLSAVSFVGPMVEQSDTQTYDVPQGATTLILENGIGDVTVREAREGEKPSLQVSRTWGLVHPETTVTQDGSSVRVVGRCNDWISLQTCDTSWALVVPAGTDVDASQGVGSVTVEGLSGDVLAQVGAGEVSVQGSTASRVEVDAGTGSVHVDTVEPPAQVSVDAGVGDVEIVVPGGRYAVRSAGLLTVGPGVADDDSAERRIDVSAGVGEVTVTAR